MRKRPRQTYGPMCGRINRRTFLADCGIGSVLARDGVARADAPVATEAAHALPTGHPHFPPKAKSVIWIFLSGGVSHLETFDPKPVLNGLAGKTYDESKLPNPQKSPLF